MSKKFEKSVDKKGKGWYYSKAVARDSGAEKNSLKKISKHLLTNERE